ncbi:protection of telomeres protein [Anaeramoeba flamelloides]|uniref:Protection of telomeres protein n=1 Tax=Anaeramoeba flamelloides TaxID=1746091 RepID=A0AAV7ZWH3_9EUKA|nr:protection of telomeres protein [Anaeramoeba flamelloides]
MLRKRSYQNPEEHLKRRKTKDEYNFVSIQQSKPKNQNKFNMVGVVAECTTLFKSPQNNFGSSFILVDPETCDVESGFQIFLYSDTRDNFPIIQQYDIIFIWDVYPYKHSNKIGGFIRLRELSQNLLIYENFATQSIEPKITLHQKVRMCQHNLNYLNDLRLWSVKNKKQLKCSTRYCKNLQEINFIGNYRFDLISKIQNIVKQKTKWIITVWDGITKEIEIHYDNLISFTLVRVGHWVKIRYLKVIDSVLQTTNQTRVMILKYDYQGIEHIKKNKNIPQNIIYNQRNYINGKNNKNINNHNNITNTNNNNNNNNNIDNNNNDKKFNNLGINQNIIYQNNQYLFTTAINYNKKFKLSTIKQIKQDTRRNASFFINAVAIANFPIKIEDFYRTKKIPSISTLPSTYEKFYLFELTLKDKNQDILNVLLAYSDAEYFLNLPNSGPRCLKQDHKTCKEIENRIFGLKKNTRSSYWIIQSYVPRSKQTKKYRVYRTQLKLLEK